MSALKCDQPWLRVPPIVKNSFYFSCILWEARTQTFTIYVFVFLVHTFIFGWFCFAWLGFGCEGCIGQLLWWIGQIPKDIGKKRLFFLDYVVHFFFSFLAYNSREYILAVQCMIHFQQAVGGGGGWFSPLSPHYLVKLDRVKHYIHVNVSTLKKTKPIL